MIQHQSDNRIILIGFDLIRLETGENAVYESGEYEIGLVIFQRTCSVKVDDVTFDKLGAKYIICRFKY